MGGGPNGDNRIGYSDLPFLYCPLSFSISWFQTIIKRIFKRCNYHSLVTLNWLDGRNLSGQVCTLLQRRNKIWGKLWSKSARKGFSFGRSCFTNGNSGFFFFCLENHRMLFLSNVWLESFLCYLFIVRYFQTVL